MKDQSRGRVRVDLPRALSARHAQFASVHTRRRSPFVVRSPNRPAERGTRSGLTRPSQSQASLATPGQQQTEFRDVTTAQSAVVRPGCKDRAHDDRSDQLEFRPSGFMPEFKRSKTARRKTRPRLQDDHARVALSLSPNHRCAYPRPARRQG